MRNIRSINAVAAYGLYEVKEKSLIVLSMSWEDWAGLSMA